MKEPISIKKIEEPNSNELIQFITKPIRKEKHEVMKMG